VEQHPFSYQPDPAHERYVQPLGGKLVRRGPRAWSIVWQAPSGEARETPLAPVSLEIDPRA
jgi:hypothetical protein